MNDCTLEHSSENRKSFRICNDVGLSTHPRRHKRSLVREGFVRLVSSKPDGKKKLPLLTNGAKYVTSFYWCRVQGNLFLLPWSLIYSSSIVYRH